jgi:hypothetical protein
MPASRAGRVRKGRRGSPPGVSEQPCQLLRRRGTYRSEHREREAGETAEVWAAIFLPPLARESQDLSPPPAPRIPLSRRPPVRCRPHPRLIHMAILTLWPGSGRAGCGTRPAASQPPASAAAAGRGRARPTAPAPTPAHTRADFERQPVCRRTPGSARQTTPTFRPAQHSAERRVFALVRRDRDYCP